MKRTIWAWGLAGGCGLLLVTAALQAQDKKPGQDPKKPDAPKAEPKPSQAQQKEGPAGGDEMAEMMKRWAEYGTPGENQKRLDPLIGKWDYETRWWLSSDTEPQTSKGSGEYTWLFDGRYVEQEVTTPAQGPDGKPFRGLGLTGYDNMKKEYVFVWLDNMSTGVMTGTGTYDPAKKEITFKGESPDPLSGQLHKPWRAVTRIVSNDKHVFEMHVAGPDGKEFKEMEITYTRAK